MSQIANITVNDGAATPVAHVLVPMQTTPSAIWRDSDVAKPYRISQFQLTATRKEGAGAKGLTRVRLALVLPTMGDGTTLPASEVDYSNQVTVEFILPNRGLKQERDNCRTLMANILQDAQIVSMVDDLQAAY